MLNELKLQIYITDPACVVLYYALQTNCNCV